ncbi:site-specific integrase [Ectobacillus antri]|uniref:site-specific integrase n=1 Tax=Ectobacillus antri TaxID=2486280 RepID=UPI0034DDF74C
MRLTQTFDEFILYIQIEKNYSTRTIDSYSHDFKCLMNFLHTNARSIDLADLTPSLCRRFIQHEVLNRGIQPRTIQRRISCLKSFSQYCLKERLITCLDLGEIKQT